MIARSPSAAGRKERTGHTACRVLASLRTARRKVAQHPRRLNVGVRAAPGENVRAPVSSDLVEPLTERELQVLRLMAADLTSPEIARELVVSANTVRTHIQHIYQKLAVHSRYEAILRARELGLL